VGGRVDLYFPLNALPVFAFHSPLFAPLVARLTRLSRAFGDVFTTARFSRLKRRIMLMTLRISCEANSRGRNEDNKGKLGTVN